MRLALELQTATMFSGRRYRDIHSRKLWQTTEWEHSITCHHTLGMIPKCKQVISRESALGRCHWEWDQVNLVSEYGTFYEKKKRLIDQFVNLLVSQTSIIPTALSTLVIISTTTTCITRKETANLGDAQCLDFTIIVISCYWEVLIDSNCKKKKKKKKKMRKCLLAFRRSNDNILLMTHFIFLFN